MRSASDPPDDSSDPGAAAVAAAPWAELEAFLPLVHGSLDPTKVAYLVANEGRRLIGCDRLSVGLGPGRRPAVAAVSGTSGIDHHSTLIRSMRDLFRRVLTWGEPLVYRGIPDETLPPAVLHALDAYLAASGSKFLLVLPLRDDRERRRGRSPRSALLMECFNPTLPPEHLRARLEVVGRHAVSALYNATEYRRLPLAWLGRPLARLRDGLGERARILRVLALTAAAALLTALAFLPRPLKIEAQGRLWPVQRRWVYSPREGQVVRFEEGLRSGEPVAADQALALLYDAQLEAKMVQLANDIAGSQQAVEALARQEAEADTEADRLRVSAEKQQKEFFRDRKSLELQALRRRTHADDNRPGHFRVYAPFAGTVLSTDFRETLTGRSVKPSEPLLRLGDRTGPWEVELKIPQNGIHPVLSAFAADASAADLEVDLLLASCPTRRFKGRLARDRITGQANPNPDTPTRPEPVVLASVRLDGLDIPEAQRVPPELLLAGTEVRVKVYCGLKPLGYGLFHGLCDFFYEQVVFSLF